jgi:hypothetical protein
VWTAGMAGKGCFGPIYYLLKKLAFLVYKNTVSHSLLQSAANFQRGVSEPRAYCHKVSLDYWKKVTGHAYVPVPPCQFPMTDSQGYLLTGI